MVIFENRINKKVAKIWVERLSEVEENTLNQINFMLEIPDLYKHIAIMPDAHLGKGAVIGGVVATKDYIFPNIVGVDIGCGMSAINTKITFERNVKERSFWQKWASTVESNIPLGFNQYKKKQDIGDLDIPLKASSLNNLKDKAKMQLGTLGGGNHFIEAQRDEDNNIWLMVHSGSRHIGLRIASHHNKQARYENEKNNDGTPYNLWFLRLNSKEGQNYYHDMNWAISYALENRWRILQKSSDMFFEHLNKNPINVRKEGINIHHNFANLEKHFGKEVIIHRKGATQASNGQIGVIPGSMGTSSYIVIGKGNPESYMSCSHGSGRVMSRREAKRSIKKSSFDESLKGTYTQISMKFVDEAPEAYKSIEDVMKNQEDLVEIVHKLEPIITIKG